MNKKFNNIYWTADEVTLLTRYWQKGLTATEIVKMLPHNPTHPKSRSAILGKIKRNAITRHA